MSQARPFDPASLADPVAVATEWTPCSAGGASFRTHTLSVDGAQRAVLTPTVGAFAFSGVFAAVGMYLLVALFNDLARGKAPAAGPFAMALLFGLAFGAAGAATFWSMRPVVFDRAAGLFWRGFSASAPARCEALSGLHALQVISEYCSGRRRSFYSYELNLVFADGRRVNVVDHGDLPQLRRDAAALAEYLGVPLWDPVG